MTDVLVKPLEEIKSLAESIQSFTVETPVGQIEASASGVGSDYPGIRISVNDNSYVYVEYDHVKKAIQVCTYDNTSDEPKDIYVIAE